MKNVMVRAWEITRGAVAKFGGSARQYFSQALSMAWVELKNEFASSRVVVINNKDNKTKTVVGEVDGGYHPSNVFEVANKREFQSALAHLINNRGFKVVSYYEINAGVKKFMGVQTY